MEEHDRPDIPDVVLDEQDKNAGDNILSPGTGDKMNSDNPSLEDHDLLLENIRALEAENKDLKNAYMRLSADTDNYRKRIEQEKELYKKFATRDVVEHLLPVIDNLQLSIQAANSSDVDSLRTGVTLILTQCETILKDLGVEKILISPGDEFNPQISEAVLIEDIENAPHNMVVSEVLQDGCTIAGHIIRVAKVKVARKSIKT